MAAALFGRLDLVGGEDASEEVSVRSAGLMAGGFASPPEVLTTMAELDIDLSGHCSTQVSPALVSTSDVVLGMARRHAREAVLMDPGAWGRTYTVKEFVRRGDTVGRRGPDEELGAWLARLHDGRKRTDMVGRSADDDVADPIGRPLDAFRDTARQLETLVDQVASLLLVPRGIRSRPG